MMELTYVSYLVISIAMTIWVARTLSKNGAVFLVDSFRGNVELANSVNHMLVVGFYLINFGFILLTLKTSKNIETTRECMEFLSIQIGTVLLVLGALHILNVLVIANWRERVVAKREREQEALEYQYT